MNTITFNKDLPGKTRSMISGLEEKFSTLLQQMTYFKAELDRHHGKAAVRLQEKMVKNLDFFSKFSSRLLYFADTVLNFVNAVAALDSAACATNTLTSRAEYQYTFSTNRFEEEVKLTPHALKDETEQFEGTLIAVDDLLTEFHTLLNQVIYETTFPWDDVDASWHSAKTQISSIIQMAKHRIEDMSKSAHLLIDELTRVDNLLSHQMIK